MKVLFLNAYFYPEGIASSYLGHHIREALIEAGFPIVLYAPVPSRGVPEVVRKEYGTKKKNEKWYDGKMSIHRFWTTKERESVLLRAIRYFFVVVKLLNRGLFAKDARSCGLMFIPSTPPIMGVMASLVKSVRGVPFIYNLQDVFPDSLVGTGMTRQGSLLWKIGRKIEDYTYRHADKIIVISEDFKKNIMAKGVPEEKIAVIYNWVDEHAVVPVAKADNPLYEEFGIDPVLFTLVYAGNLGNAQNIEILLSAASSLLDVQFVIFGTGGLEDTLRTEIEQRRLKNVRLLPLQPMDRVRFVYSLGDVCVVSCKAGLGGSAMPSKTWNIMSCGRPVLASFDEGELKDILEQNDCGVFTHAGDVAEFVAAVRRLSDDRTTCSVMGANARQFILDHLTRSAGTNKYVDVVKGFDR